MANTYVKAAFTIFMSRQDASIIRDAEKACEIINAAGGAIDLAPDYDRLGLPFRNAFPARDGNPFGAFFAIFDDPVYPMFDCDIAYGLPDATGTCEVTFCGDQFGVEQVAMLLFAGCKSALPCAFEYAYDCDRLNIGEFGGGAAVITAQGVTHYATARLIHQALTAALTEAEAKATVSVLPKHRDADEWLTMERPHA
jgi:hypothetical protein